MSDDKSKRGAADRSRVSTSESYEMRDLARKTDMPVKLVEKIARDYGPMRAPVERKLKEMKRNGRT